MRVPHLRSLVPLLFTLVVMTRTVSLAQTDVSFLAMLLSLSHVSLRACVCSPTLCMSQQRPETMAGTLAFIVMLSICKESIEDYARHKKDYEVNHKPTTV